MCCLMAPEKMSPVAPAEVARGRERFVYLVELRSNPGEAALSQPDYSLVSLPAEVERALGQRRAVVLVSYAHEGSREFRTGRLGRSRILRTVALHSPLRDHVVSSIYDALRNFASRYSLSPEQLWFVSANLEVHEEVAAWHRARRLTHPVFTVRQCEIASFGMGLITRESLLRGRGPNVVSLISRDPANQYLPFHRAKVAWAPNPFNAYRAGDAWVDPRWRFASMNRTFRRHRWWVIERLYREGLLGYGCVSFPKMTPDRLREAGKQELAPELSGLIDRLPLDIDHAWTRDWDQAHYDSSVAETTAAVISVPAAVARESACEIVTETYYDQSGDVGRMVTEKTFKSLLGRGPSIIVGSRRSVDYLRSVGVETWNDVVDESYDDMADWIDGTPTRLNAALDAALEIVRSPHEARRVSFACRHQQECNMRWLVEAEKPWDRLLRELEETLAQL